MIDAKYLEFINKEIDGKLSPRERKELQSYLANNCEARELSDDLKRMARTLSQVPDVQPSPNLKKYIMNSIPVNKYRPKAKRSPLQNVLSSVRLNFKYVSIFAVGLLVGVLLSVFAKMDTVNTSDVTGTLLLKDREPDVSSVSKYTIAATEASGMIELKSAGDLVLVDVRLQSEQTVMLQVQFNANDLTLMEFRRGNDGELNANFSENSLQLSNLGVQNYSLVFKNKTARKSSLNFLLSSAGKNILEKRVTAPQPNVN